MNSNLPLFYRLSFRCKYNTLQREGTTPYEGMQLSRVYGHNEFFQCYDHF